MRSVSKFGGSSIKDAKGMLHCARILRSHPQTSLVVISAIRNITNELETMARLSFDNKKDKALSLLKKTASYHLQMALELKGDDGLKNQLDIITKTGEQLIGDYKSDPSFFLDQLYSLGERYSALLFVQALREVLDRKIILVDSWKLIITDEKFGKAEPNPTAIKTATEKLIPYLNQKTLIVTQGFIGGTPSGDLTTLGREGSDLTGSLLARAINASTYTIWTDVDGVYDRDPATCSHPLLYDEITYKQAENLALAGAKVLHSKTLRPLYGSDISVFVRNSLRPHHKGTRIKP